MKGRTPYCSISRPIDKVGISVWNLDFMNSIMNRNHCNDKVKAGFN